MIQAVENSKDSQCRTVQASFREEVREIAVDIEPALLKLSENPHDQELIGRVFRAFHTIRGSGSMPGFEKLAAFTHKPETAFNKVRDGRLQINSQFVDLALAAFGQIRSMVEEGQGEAASDPALCAEILNGELKLTGATGWWH